jgi:nucleotide-binding universal stress UspA family protein
MASHGRRGVDRLLLGSQANEVLTRSKVPALIVR